MWKAAAGAKINISAQYSEDDDWETDADFVNDVSEKEQRWGSKTVQGSGHLESMNLTALRQDVIRDDAIYKHQQFELGPKASEGYGGRFGVHKDRMDQSSVGFDYEGKMEKHASQKGEWL